jgi:hypothetical protein
MIHDAVVDTFSADAISLDGGLHLERWERRKQLSAQVRRDSLVRSKRGDLTRDRVSHMCLPFTMRKRLSLKILKEDDADRAL